MRRRRRFLLIGRAVLVIITLLLATQFLSAQEEPLRRFGLFIGANDGGSDRIRLRWAIADAQRMAMLLSEYKHPFRLVFFEGGDHGLSEHQEEVNTLIVQWFNKYFKNPESFP